MPIGRDRVLLEIPSDALHPLKDAFLAYVDRAFEDPWPSTKFVQDYLAIDVLTVNVRGERSGSQTQNWYTQLTFSACAGMAETSAEVAAHWAEIWYRRAGAELAAKYFLPFGFTPEHADTTGAAKLFVPLGGMGYAQFRGDEDARPVDPEIRNFELDWAVLETLSEIDLTREWQELDEALADVRAAGVCLCQLCAPGQDLSRFDRLAITKREP